MNGLFNIETLDKISTFEDDKYCKFVKDKLKFKLDKIFKSRAIEKNKKNSSRLHWAMERLFDVEELKSFENLITIVDESLEILKVAEEIQKSTIEEPNLLDNAVDEGTLNEIVILESVASKLILQGSNLNKTAKGKLMKTLHETSFRHSLALKIETMVLKKFHKEGCSIQESLNIAAYKNPFDVIHPILLAFTLAGIEISNEIDLILENISQLYQIKNDFKQYKSNISQTSWIVAKMLNLSTLEQKRNILKAGKIDCEVLNDHYNIFDMTTEVNTFCTELIFSVNAQVEKIANEKAKTVFFSLMTEINEDSNDEFREICEFSMQ